MAVISRLLHTTTGKYLLSVILGLGIASLFRSVCSGRNCDVYSAPPREEIDEKVFKFDGKCYAYTPKHVKCDNKKKIVAY